MNAQPSDLWIAELCGQTLGPLNRGEIRDLIAAGSLNPLDRISRVGTKEWNSVSEFDRLCEWPIHQEVEPRLTDSENFTTLPHSLGEFSDLQDSPHSESQADSPPPQFFLKLGRAETGPVPLEAMMELIQQGALPRSTLVRREDSNEWQSADRLISPEAVPLKTRASPEADPDAADDIVQHVRQAESLRRPDEASVHSRSQLGAVLWVLQAPLHYLASLVMLLISLGRNRVIAIMGLIITLGAVIFSVYQDWSIIVGSGTVTIDGRPMSNVIVTLMNMKSGEMASGFAGSSGAFSLKSASGHLSHGRYRVTINRPEEHESSGEPSVPTTYRWLATSRIEWEYDGQPIKLSLTSVKAAKVHSK